MLKNEVNEAAAVDLIVLLNRNGIETKEAKSTLLEIAESQFNRVGHRAISVLAAQNSPPENSLSVIMSYVLSDEYAADPILTQSLPRFGQSAVQYLGVLEKLRLRLVEQIHKPQMERSITLYNDSFYLEQLERTISLLSENSGRT